MRLKDVANKKQIKTLVSFKLDKDTLAAVKKQLKIDNMTMTSLICAAIKIYIDDSKTTKKESKWKL